MAEKEMPLLMKELTIGEKIALGQVSRLPGFQVIVKLIEAGCNKATADTINLNPEDTNYDQLLKAKHNYSHSINKFTRLVRNSINYHVEHGVVEDAEEQEKAKKLIDQQKESK
jgi:hypothetical protein